MKKRVEYRDEEQVAGVPCPLSPVRCSLHVVRRVLLMLLACAVPLLVCAADRPLTQDDVRLLLIGGASSQKMVDLIGERGIDFSMSADLAKHFRDDGADDAVIDALQKAPVKPAHAAAAPSASAPAPGTAPAASPPAGPVLARPSASSASPNPPPAAPTPSAPAPAPDAAPAASPPGPVLVRPAASSSTASAPPAATTTSSAQTSSSSDSTSGSVEDRIQGTLAAADAKPTETAPPEDKSGPVLVRAKSSPPAPRQAAAGSGSPAAVPTTASAAAKPGAAAKPALTDPSPDQTQAIIKEFAAKEKLFKEARDNYTYHQINKVETLGGDNQVTGMWQQEWDIVYDDAGKRVEKVTYAPADTLKDLIMTEQDLDAMRRIAPFVLTTDDLPEYDIKYLGHVPVDQLTCYVFSVRPKEIQKGRQYFQGVVWVDDRDLQIVKAEGKNVPELMHSKNGENLFPRFTTYREQIDGKYWFPTFTIADQNLYFSGAPPVHVKEVVRYTEYKQFKSGVTIKMIGAVDGKGQNQQQGTPAKKPDQKPQQ